MLRAATSRSAWTLNRSVLQASTSCAACRTLARSSSKRQASTVASTSTAADAQTSSAPSAIEEHDIVIVGGGLVGLALANALSTSKTVRSAQCRISLLEAGDLDKIADWKLPPGKWSNRISSITESSQAFLKSSGSWQKLDFGRTRPCEDMQVWDGLSGARIAFEAWDVHPDAANQPEMAKFVENLHLQKAMLNNLREQDRVECIDKTRVKDIIAGDLKTDGGWPIVSLDNGRRIRARLLVGADGFNSPVKNYSDITTSGWAYDAHCLVGTLELSNERYDPNTTAWQRFLPVGPLGMLPIADNIASLAWSTKPEIAAGLKKLDSPTLAAIINAGFRLPWSSLDYLLNRVIVGSENLAQEIAWRSSPEVLQPADVPNERSMPPLVTGVHLETCASFPLKLSHADSYIAENNEDGLPMRTVLIGDAAHTVHPMAGQGLNMGLGDAQALAETIEEALNEGADIGSKLALNPYPRKRYLTNHNIMSFIDKLHKLYAVQSAPVVWARSQGVEILNQLPSIKGAMMDTAGAGNDLMNGTRAPGLWGAAAKAVEAVGSARMIGGALLGGLRNKLAERIATR